MENTPLVIFSSDTRIYITILGLYGLVYAGRDVCQDGMFFISGLHENVSIGDDLDFTRDNL